MSDTRNGGPAFPSGEAYSANGVISRKGPLYEGMTLRDYFAAKAMQATLTHGKTLYVEHDAFFHIENVAKDSYYIADAMLKEREI